MVCRVSSIATTIDEHKLNRAREIVIKQISRTVAVVTLQPKFANLTSWWVKVCHGTMVHSYVGNIVGRHYHNLIYSHILLVRHICVRD